MKKHLFLLLSSVCMTLMVSNSLFAEDVKIDGIYYTLDHDNKTASVTHGALYYDQGSRPKYPYTGSIFIPETVTYNESSYRVTSIGDFAFAYCPNLTGVLMTDAILTIDWMAFRKCTGLTAIYIGNNVTTIGGDAFDGCTNLNTVYLYNPNTTIHSSAFYGCNISKIVFLNTLELWLQKTYDPSYISSSYTLQIGYSEIITDLTLPNTVTRIGDNAFKGCTSLSSITISNSVKSIGYRAFEGCSDLTSVSIANSVTKIENKAFKDCSALTDVSLPTGIKSLQDSVFFNCSQLDSIIIPDNVKSIGEHVFQGCTVLNAIAIPPMITDIGHCAFCDCNISKLYYTGTLEQWLAKNYNPHIISKSYSLYIDLQEVTDLVIPDYITEINGDTFYGCKSLTSVTIHTNLTSIGEDAFRACKNISKIYYTGTLEQWIKRAFDPRDISSSYSLYIDNAEVTDLVIPSSITSINDHAFSCCKSLTSVSIPNSVVRIGEGAFRGCKGIVSVTIPNSVTSIGDYTFSDCSSLTSIDIPNNVTRIGKSAFERCSDLLSVTIPNSVTKIEESTFYGCTDLSSVTIPNSVTKIASRAFSECTGFRAITCEATTPPECEVIYYGYEGEVFSFGPFDNVERSIPLYVPKQSVALYESADVWKEFTKIQGVEMGIEEVSGNSGAADVRKAVIDGKVYILRNGKTYTVQGQRIMNNE